MTEDLSAERRKRVKRATWLLALTVVGIYVGYILWNLSRSA